MVFLEMQRINDCHARSPHALSRCRVGLRVVVDIVLGPKSEVLSFALLVKQNDFFSFNQTNAIFCSFEK